ncbi:unnamed protein product [Lota lota]
MPRTTAAWQVNRMSCESCASESSSDELIQVLLWLRSLGPCSTPWDLAPVPGSWLRPLGLSGPRESGVRSAWDLHKQIPFTVFTPRLRSRPDQTRP